MDFSEADQVQKLVIFYELDLGLNHVSRKWSEPVDNGANLIVAVPGGGDCPGGVLVCAENFVALPNQQTVEYPSFKLVLVGDGGSVVQGEAEFTNLHIPDNNLIRYRQGAQIVSSVFDVNDLIPRANLPIAGAQLPGGNNVRAWDPYTREWWDFQVIIQNNSNYLQGWSDYNARHRFAVGDEIRFKWASHPSPQINDFAMIEHMIGTARVFV